MSLVTLDDLAARLGLSGNPAVYVTDRGYEIHTDWAGRAAVTTDDAAALVAETGSPTWDATPWDAITWDQPTGEPV